MKKVKFHFLGPTDINIHSRGTGGTKKSVNADLIIVETYVQQGKTIESQFFIYGPKCIFYISGYLSGPGGGGGGGIQLSH